MSNRCSRERQREMQMTATRRTMGALQSRRRRGRSGETVVRYTSGIIVIVPGMALKSCVGAQSVADAPLGRDIGAPCSPAQPAVDHRQPAQIEGSATCHVSSATCEAQARGHDTCGLAKRGRLPCDPTLCSILDERLAPRTPSPVPVYRAKESPKNLTVINGNRRSQDTQSTSNSGITQSSSAALGS